MSYQPLLDLSRLQDALGDDPELISEILAMYRDTAGTDLMALEAAVSSGVADQIVRRAHALKGASGNVGADRMMALAGEIEKAARGGDLRHAAAAFPKLKAVFHETLAQAFPEHGLGSP